MRTGAVFTVACAAVLCVSSGARAFVGFHVTRGAPAASEASAVVVMRDGDTTIVTTRTSYRGPPVDSAFVVPVPPGVDRGGVRALDPDALDRIDRSSAPRLVEHGRSPCPVGPADRLALARSLGEPEAIVAYGVDASEIARWLRARGYLVPDELATAVRSYVEAGYGFLVARLDASRATTRQDGRAYPPPLRFHYRSEEIVLPLRLADLGGTRRHDLVVHVLDRGHRREAANRPNVLAPTNLEMFSAARERFGEVYATIVDRVLERHPGAIVTEYAWDAGACDPCTAAPLGPADLDALGRGVGGAAPASSEGFVLTRLHTWTGGVPQTDLVLRRAPPIAGGRHRSLRDGRLDVHIDRRGDTNAFQAHYVIRRPQGRRVACVPPARSSSVTTIIPKGQLRRYLLTWTPVLRIPQRGDALPATLVPAAPRPGRGERRAGRP